MKIMVMQILVLKNKSHNEGYANASPEKEKNDEDEGDAKVSPEQEKDNEDDCDTCKC